MASKTIMVRYFAELRELSNCQTEEVAEAPDTAAELYLQLKQRYGFRLELDEIKVAINGAFAHLDSQLAPGAEVAFIPPVSGG